VSTPTSVTTTQPPVRLFALATAVIVLSLYQAQPLVGQIGASLGLSAAVADLVSTLTLLGYATGLFLLVPLCDIFENRRLIMVTLAANALALLMAASPVPVAAFLTASFFIGLTATAIQMLIPMAAAMSAESQRGRVIGNIMSGMMLGIMLSRPLASLIAGRFGWRASYALLAGTVTVLMLALARAMPPQQPRHLTRYNDLLTSLITLWREEPILRRHATSVALCFAAFNAFWSLVALRLAASPFGLSTNGIALFAFVGISGAISAPLAGQLGDRGKSRIARSAAHIGIALAVLLAWLGGSTHLLTTPTARLAVLVIAALLLDAGTIADLTLGRRAVNLLRTEARGRINGLFTGVIFVGGAIGSAVAGIAWAHAGWSGVCFIALMLALIATWYGMRRESSIFAAVTE